MRYKIKGYDKCLCYFKCFFDMIISIPVSEKVKKVYALILLEKSRSKEINCFDH